MTDILKGVAVEGPGEEKEEGCDWTVRVPAKKHDSSNALIEADTTEEAAEVFWPLSCVYQAHVAQSARWRWSESC